MLKKIIAIVIVALFLFIPEVRAADYEITNVQIDAFLQADGDVAVEERHTYQFTGEFNGIIRNIEPKAGTTIADFQAFEGSVPLKVETDGYEYRIHRAGEDETIEVTLAYLIEDGVTAYADVAEFYWPFFDDRNDSSYEQLMITVHPPEPTTDVIAFGYDEAFKKESIIADGVVQYQYGRVESNRKGDIRVAYDVALFGAVSERSDKQMRAEIEAAKQQLLSEETLRLERQESLATVGQIIIPIFALLLIFVLARAWIESKARKQAIDREISRKSIVPEGTLSLPATIYFTNYRQLLPETVAAALLDLVRKGYVEQVGDDRFYIVNRNGLLGHEEKLVEWLFDQIGAKNEFSFDDLTSYTKNVKNHTKYQQLQAAWKKAVRAEWQDANLYEDKSKYRLLITCLSLVLVPFAFLFVIHDLIAFFLAASVMAMALFVFAISHKPKTWQGERIYIEWQQFKQKIPMMTDADWQQLSENDRMRAFIYGLGVNEKSLKKKNESLTKVFKAPVHSGGLQSTTAYGFDPTWIIIAAAATSNFQSAEETTGIDNSSSATGGGASSGSGVGGGGGGSGAF